MSISPSFLELLVHPQSKQPLINQQEQLVSGEDSFNLLNSKIPVLLSKSEVGQFNYREHYEEDAIKFDYTEEWIPSNAEENRRLHQHILHKIPESAKWVLDVGCGNGWLAKELLPKGKDVISMDISTRNPLKAIANFPSDRHHGLVADVYELPIKDQSLDCIVAAEIIEHVVDPEKFIDKLISALKPGGTLIITTPNNEMIPKSLCIHCNQLTPHNAHIHSFTEESIKSLVTQNVSAKETSIHNSKILVVLQIHMKLRKLPFAIWNFIDQTIIKFKKKYAYRLMLTVKK